MVGRESGGNRIAKAPEEPLWNLNASPMSGSCRATSGFLGEYGDSWTPMAALTDGVLRRDPTSFSRA
jgi:hypothetical protein